MPDRPTAEPVAAEHPKLLIAPVPVGSMAITATIAATMAPIGNAKIKAPNTPNTVAMAVITVLRLQGQPYRPNHALLYWHR